jgi:hypothetical protein
LQKAFTLQTAKQFTVNLLSIKLLVDGEEISLNEFASKILSGTVVGAVTSLRGINKEWKKIEIEVTRQAK